MSDIAIRVENLSKRYRIGTGLRYKTLRDTLTDAMYAPFRGARSLALRAAGRKPAAGDSGGDGGFVWALKDVSFQVQQGEVLGIIGRNGAGKTTVLKVLSRVTEPTLGRAEVRGRVGSLLEVGTGFHPELTGRENVFLNGAILGMTRAEISRKFDEIVAFAEVEKFLDTAVKRYSSGMQMRLAFAVAAHLEPEILLVDEVLAVGDAAFQRKCLGKMQGVGQEGRTVLFVSHNMPAITRLCQRTILLDAGGVVADGPSHEVVTTYLRSGIGTTAAREWPDMAAAPGNEIVRLRAVRVRTEDGRTVASVDIRQPVGIEVEYEVLKDGLVLVPNVHFFNEQGIYAFAAADHDPTWRRRPRPPGRYVSTAWVPGNFLAEGSMIVGAAVTSMNPLVIHLYERDAVAFEVMDTLEGDSARGDYGGPMLGVVRPLLRWTTEFNTPGSESRVISERAAESEARGDGG